MVLPLVVSIFINAALLEKERRLLTPLFSISKGHLVVSKSEGTIKSCLDLVFVTSH